MFIINKKIFNFVKLYFKLVLLGIYNFNIVVYILGIIFFIKEFIK